MLHLLTLIPLLLTPINSPRRTRRNKAVTPVRDFQGLEMEDVERALVRVPNETSSSSSQYNPAELMELGSLKLQVH